MKSTISEGGWKILYILTGTIDAVQLGIDFIPGYGEVFNEIADEVVAVILGLYLYMKGSLSFRAFVGLIIADIGEEATAAALPLWIAEVWYAHKRVMAEKAAGTEAVVNSQMAANGPLNQGNIRPPDTNQQRPLNIVQDGVSMRPPTPTT
jgi:hypothetical protein